MVRTVTRRAGHFTRRRQARVKKYFPAELRHGGKRFDRTAYQTNRIWVLAGLDRGRSLQLIGIGLAVRGSGGRTTQSTGDRDGKYRNHRQQKHSHLVPRMKTAKRDDHRQQMTGMFQISVSGALEAHPLKIWGANELGSDDLF